MNNESAGAKLGQATDGLEESTIAPENVPKKRQGRRRVSGIFAIFIVLVALGVAAYGMYLWQTQQAVNATAINAVKASQAGLTQELALLREAVETLQLKPANEGLDELREQIMAELEEIRRRLGVSSQDWLLAEVEYLVRMANQQVLMEGDTEAAIDLLQSADSIVRDAQGLTAHDLRQALAKDIAALRSVNPPDVQGTYLELSALMSQVAMLKQTRPVFEKKAAVEKEEKEPASTAFSDQSLELVSNIGSRLARLIDFRRGDTFIKPILSPEEAHYLRQSLILKLQVAQMALLEGKGVIFKSVMTEASARLADGFDKDDAATLAMQTSLARLGEMDVEATLPDISGSLVAVRRALADFHQAESR